jgi:hypothetical protein
MRSSKPRRKHGFLTKAHRIISPKGQVPAELQQAINECSTLEQLMEFLFTTDFVKDEAILDAFDKRMEELEASF